MTTRKRARPKSLPRSPWFIYRRVMTTILDGGAVQTLELDFQLGQGLGVEIAGSWLTPGEYRISGTQDAIPIISSLQLSLHRRTGTLTNELTPAADSDFPQAEVLQGAQFGFVLVETAAAGGGGGFFKTGQDFIQWTELLGEPLLVVANLTLRAETSAAASGSQVWDGPAVVLLYRIIPVTDRDLARAFIARQ